MLLVLLFSMSGIFFKIAIQSSNLGFHFIYHQVGDLYFFYAVKMFCLMCLKASYLSLYFLQKPRQMEENFYLAICLISNKNSLTF